jgi:hypothetical protein
VPDEVTGDLEAPLTDEEIEALQACAPYDLPRDEEGIVPPEKLQSAAPERLWLRGLILPTAAYHGGRFMSFLQRTGRGEDFLREQMEAERG